MSTGDQTQYVRAKIAERGSTRGAHFMTDGFDRWAESETPARAGQMEKIPAESQMENYGGAMTLHRAKKLHMSMGGKMHGGDLLATAKKAVQEAKKLIDMWRGVSQWLNDLKSEIEDEILTNPSVPPSYKNIATKILEGLEYIKGAQTVLDGVAGAASLVGLGKHGGRQLHGGAFSLEDIGKYAAQIAYWYGWFRENSAGIRPVLSMRALQPVGKEVLKYVEPILKALGAGRRVGGKKCCCSDSESEYHGGVLPILDVSAMSRKVGGRRHGGAQQALDSEFTGVLNRGPAGRWCGPGDDPYLDRCTRHTEMPGAQKAAMLGGRRHGGALSKADRDRLNYERHLKTKEMQEMMLQQQSMGGRRHGGIGVAEKMELMSPEDRKYMMAAEKRKSQSVPMGGRKPSARGAIVKKVMREQGLSLPQASKYVKEHGLY